MEFDVLAMLANNAGSVVKRDDLYTTAMGIEYDGFDRGLDVHVSRIRRKLERAGFDSSRLKSVRGVGYLLAVR
jgi:two-component system OmpR family response regulator/two-component system response regulator RstA